MYHSLLVTVVVALVFPSPTCTAEETQKERERSEGLKVLANGEVTKDGAIIVDCTLLNQGDHSRALLVSPSAIFQITTSNGTIHSRGEIHLNSEAFGRRYVVVKPTAKEATRFHPDEVLHVYFRVDGEKDEDFVGAKVSVYLTTYEIVPSASGNLKELKFSIEGIGILRTKPGEEEGDAGGKAVGREQRGQVHIRRQRVAKGRKRCQEPLIGSRHTLKE